MREITLPKKYVHRDNIFEKMVCVERENEKMVGIEREKERKDDRYTHGEREKTPPRR